MHCFAMLLFERVIIVFSLVNQSFSWKEKHTIIPHSSFLIPHSKLIPSGYRVHLESPVHHTIFR